MSGVVETDAVSAGTLLVDPAWLAAHLGAPGLVVLDATVRLDRPRVDGDHRSGSGRDGWTDAHVPGSQHLDLHGEFAEPDAGYHFAHPSPERAHAVLTGLGVDDASTVVVYDTADGFWSARAWWSLRALGVDALVLDGGLTAWRAAGGAVETGEDVPVAPGRGTLTLLPDPTAWATRDDVVDVVAGERQATLVCALGADQFTGTAPTRYTRRGHIPTSVNLPARALAAGADGSLLPPVAIQHEVDPVIPDGPVVLYCGGGISASYAALGLLRAGRTDVSIYDGSLEEWSADPTLPLVTL